MLSFWYIARNSFQCLFSLKFLHHFLILYFMFLHVLLSSNLNKHCTFHNISQFSIQSIQICLSYFFFQYILALSSLSSLPFWLFLVSIVVAIFIIIAIKPFSNCLQFCQFPARFLQSESFGEFGMIRLFLLNTWVRTCLSCKHAF